MYARLCFFVVLGLSLVACQPTTQPTTANPSAMLQKTDIAAPVAAKKPKVFKEHGHERIDDYYWLRERDNPEVIAYLESENAYLKEMMSHTEDLQQKLFEEMKGRIKETDQSVPYKDNGYYYLTRYEEGQEYPIYSRKKGSLEAPEEVLLNVNELAKPYNYYNIAGRSVSPDNKILAYGEDTLSRRIYTLRFKNLETGELLEDFIPNTGGNAVWANDNQHVFYTVKDETLRQYQIWRHKLGTPASADQLVYEEADDTFSTFVYKSKSKQYIIIGSYQTVSTEFRVLDADQPTGEFRIIQPRERGLEYEIAHFKDKFY
ncbi:MAG: S9 family peptidase, partial [Bacteroidetes bacterium]